ncbi:MAG: S1/P1 Nuclease [Bacteroidetes bacterium]|nr:S1/P1 Nuclease [Bacteroidota bacterium]
MKKILAVLCLFLFGQWGFFSHRMINRHAVFLLPPEMSVFYKENLEFIEEAAVNPDRRRYAVEGEAECHFIDLDVYGNIGYDSLILFIPWDSAVVKFGEDSIRKHGIVHWNLERTYYRLREAFLTGDPSRILSASADLGHYVGDAHVPLHTTSNYDGQKTGQTGLHGFWETRLPELYFQDYEYFTGQANYIPDRRPPVALGILNAHKLSQRVLTEEKILFSESARTKFSFESKGYGVQKMVSPEYAAAYHRRQDGMVEAQLKHSIKMVADLWYSAWVEAGQPDLKALAKNFDQKGFRESRMKEVNELKLILKVDRPHEAVPQN